MKRAFFTLTAACALGIAACGDASKTVDGRDSATTAGDPAKAGSNEADGRLKPKTPKPAFAPNMDDEMWAVLEKHAELGPKPIETLTPQEARMQPTVTDAAMALMKEKNIPVPAPKCDTMGKMIPVAGGMIQARVYKPRETSGPLPVIVYFHGGGWVIADNNVYGPSMQAMCEQTGAIVVGVHYRQGPEHKFPTAHNDAFAAYQWVLKNADSLGGDVKRVAVMGESAGGNLACNVSIMARDKGIQMPVHQVLVYPVAGDDTAANSMRRFDQAKPLNRPMLKWMLGHYLGDVRKASDPRIALVKAKLQGLPPTTIIAAEIDPLFDDGVALQKALQNFNVPVEYKKYDGVTHEFFGMGLVVPAAKDAEGYAAGRLKSAF